MSRAPRTLGDPFEGRAAQRTYVRRRIESMIALLLAVAALSIVAGAWVGTLAPVLTHLGS
jgi:hypothetical protein